jgi:hypothetical protein
MSSTKTLLMLGVAAAGCGGSKSTNSNSPANYGDFLQQFTQAACQKAMTCCTPNELRMGLFGLLGSSIVTSVTSCESNYGLGLGGVATMLVDASISAGRARFDAGSAAESISCVAGLSCPQFSEVVGQWGGSSLGCANPVVPLVDNGGSCALSTDCKSENCVGSTSTNLGLCQPMPTQNEACGSGVCAPGSYCPAVQVGQTPYCAPLLTNGQSCSAASECASDACLEPTETCGPAVMCDDNPADLAGEVLSDCGTNTLSDGTHSWSLDCAVGAAGAWVCACTDSGNVVGTCNFPLGSASPLDLESCNTMHCSPCPM